MFQHSNCHKLNVFYYNGNFCFLIAKVSGETLTKIKLFIFKFEFQTFQFLKLRNRVFWTDIKHHSLIAYHLSGSLSLQSTSWVKFRIKALSDWVIHLCAFIFKTLILNNWFQFVETLHEFGFPKSQVTYLQLDIANCTL